NDADESERLHMELLRNSEEVLCDLGLHYRVALACTGEIGIGQVKKHEIETWMPGRDAFCETHSCSSMHDFQAIRSNIRYRARDGSTKFVHTLNNTAIASPRILIPLLETYQREDGGVEVPPALRPYMGGIEAIEPRR
ncbi:MAG: serine--tRNA ligase, partial [Oscillospiraceae bacterium]|nr:serine--tRNA ligase [Oscillospiraceae bacterium]